MTIDGEITIVGSYNLSQKSGYCDYEAICVIHDKRLTKLMDEELENDEKDSTSINTEKSSFSHLISKYITGPVFSSLLGKFFG